MGTFPSWWRNGGVWNHQEWGSAEALLRSEAGEWRKTGMQHGWVGSGSSVVGRLSGGWGGDPNNEEDRQWQQAQQEKPAGHGKDWEITPDSRGAQWGRILTVSRADVPSTCCTWATGDWLGCWGERVTSLDVWKSYLEANQRDNGVTEARQQGQSCVLSCSCRCKASLAEASSGVCKPTKKPPRFSCKPQVSISYWQIGFSDCMWLVWALIQRPLSYPGNCRGSKKILTRHLIFTSDTWHQGTKCYLSVS